MAENDNDMTTSQEPISAQASQPIAPATPLPATVSEAEKSNSVRNYAFAAVAGVAGVLLFLGAGVIGYAIGHNDSDDYRGGEYAYAVEHDGQKGEGYGEGSDEGYAEGSDEGYAEGSDEGYAEGSDEGYAEGSDEGYGEGPMKGYDDEYGMNGGMGGNRNDGMMQGNGIQDFLNQLQGGEGLTPDQQQFLDQLKGFVGGMRNQMG
jgi:hypothetical protein